MRVLEFDKVLERLAGHCETALGASRALALQPAFDAEEVWARLGLTQEADALCNQDPPPSLGAVYDLREPVIRAAKGSVLDGETLYSIGMALSAMRQVRTHLRAKSGLCPSLWAIAEALPEFGATEERILASLDGSGEVKDSASPELGRLRKAKASAAARITERIQSYTSGKARDLLSDPIFTQRDGRYVIPLKAEHRGKIRGVVHDTSSSGQTLFIEPEDVLQLGNALREAEAAEREEVLRILTELSSRVGKDGYRIEAGIEASAQIDLTLALARLGHAMGGCVPIASKGHRLFISKGRHPLLDKETAVPLTLDVGTEFEGLLITGPNTGGKTVAIKTVGLFALMAQSGMMVPASEARLGPFTQVWADIGDEQSLQQSLSTFSGHIKNISTAIRELKPGALVLLDEIGAGTDPAEGAALAKAILLSLHAKGARIVASTHYGELKVFAYNTPGFANAAMEFDVQSLRPTYRLMMGAPGASHALRIAERCGMPKEVVELAREQAGVEQQDLARMLEKLEVAQKLAQKAQSESDKLTARLRQVEREAELKLAQAEEAKRTAKARATEAVEEALRELRLEAARVFDELKSGASPQALDRARERLRAIQEAGGELADGLRPETRGATPAKIERGMSVRVVGYNQIGTVLTDPKDGQVQVQVGMMRMNVKVTALQAAEPPKPAAKPSTHAGLGLKKMQFATTELVLVAERAETALPKLEKFIDDALLAGLSNVRIVHGKGEGILRKLTHDALRKHRGVRSFRDGDATEGGQGVTIATLE